MDAYSSWIFHLARQVRHAALEFHRATKLANELLFSYGLPETNQPPETYAEFRLRTPASSVHEPPARSRAAGQQVR
jgi:hypothetical protein